MAAGKITHVVSCGLKTVYIADLCDIRTVASVMLWLSGWTAGELLSGTLEWLPGWPAEGWGSQLETFP